VANGGAVPAPEIYSYEDCIEEDLPVPMADVYEDLIEETGDDADYMATSASAMLLKT
jgi:hypothetical protein